MKKTIVFILGILLISSTSVFAQKEFVKLETKDNVDISYRWKAYKTPEKVDSHKLVLKIENKNEYAVKINIEVGYYWETQLKASSDELTYCLKAQKAIIGDMKRGRFDSESFSYEQLCSEEFDLQLNSITVTKVENCESKLKKDK